MATLETKPDPTWPQLLGSNHWDSLLHPLDLGLRRLLLRCGDFCQATYDAFNSDQNSPFCGSSRYGKTAFFDKVQFPAAASAFSVHCFLYATSQVDLPKAFLVHSLTGDDWDRESNWMGYIAVSTDEAAKATGRREIYVAWRGTIRPLEWANVFDPELQPISPLLSRGENSLSHNKEEEKKMKVMKGWLAIYTSSNPNSPFTKLSARAQLLTKIKQLVHTYQGSEDLSIIFTGHSLGASLAVLSAFDLAQQDELSGIPVTAFVFGSPEVGNREFAEKLKTLNNLRVLHTKNTIDMIPHYPGKLLGYAHVGEELVVDTRKSPSLKDSKNPSDWHNLQAILHAVAGWNGEGEEFELRVKRSVALVNKSSDCLKDECFVPGSWWVEKNKGMVLRDDGEWVLAPPDQEDTPVPEF